MPTTNRPIWAQDVQEAFEVIRRRPRPLLNVVASLTDRPVTLGELCEFLSSAGENDPALLAARMSLAALDSADFAEHEAGAPRSTERREWLYDELGINTKTARAVFDKRIPIYDSGAVVVSREFEPWYANTVANHPRIYWKDYEKYLLHTKGWPADAVSALDQATTEVVERLSRPTREEAKQTKGLVVGYVQSGKTANFTGVAAKAIDAGYRLIIVLTGTIEILRSQTQRRMDMELIGIENILAGQDPTDPSVARELDYQQDEAWPQDFVSHAEALNQNGVVEISRVTTHHSDYKRLPQGISKLKYARRNKRRPLNDEENLFQTDAYIAIIKKNASTLKKLIQDLKPLKDDLARLPVLVIDDESDQASVDTTNPKRWKGQSAAARKRTAINQLITEILAICPRAQYVGYTATPFANVFVDPDDAHDLFPADFVLSLSRPPHYMGVREFHDLGKSFDDEPKTVFTSNELAHVRKLVGDPDSDSLRREQELQEAIDAWVLSGAIKQFREATGGVRFKHHTMLVHESVKQGDHTATASEVRAQWRRSKFATTEGMNRLRDLYERDFLPVMQARAQGQAIPRTFEELERYVRDALAMMYTDNDPVLIVNSDKEVQQMQKSLDFEAERVWRILVGGTQLSRGFTVEGLTVSYFRRKAGQADTLMQAGRWFGFRHGYADLVRLYIRSDEKVDLYAAFEALLQDEEAFREELSKYAGFDDNGMPLLEPRQIPPLVSQHLPWLKPTARNKMWNAVIANRTPVGVQDLYTVPPRGDTQHRQNLRRSIIPILAATQEKAVELPYRLAGGASGTVVARTGVLSTHRLLNYLSQYVWHDDASTTVKSVLETIKRLNAQGKVQDWLVMWPQPSPTKSSIVLPGIAGAAPLVTRRRRAGRNDLSGSDQKHRDAGLEATRSQPGGERRGLVLVYLVDEGVPSAQEQDHVPSESDLVGLLSVALPGSATAPNSQLIQWTVVNSSDPQAVVVDRS